MNWRKVDVTIAREAVEALSSTLLDITPTGIQIEEGEGVTTLTIYPPDSLPVEDIRATIDNALAAINAQGLNTGPATVEISLIGDEDWAENYKKFFKPIRIGRILIKPSWEEVADADTGVIIELDPGMAFGTGSHPTTEGCLRFLQDVIKGGETVFDLGTGSGILAIAAAKLGASRVIAIDNDDVAIAAAEENAVKNNVADKIDFTVADFASFEPVNASIVVANITAPLIIDFLPSILEKIRGLTTLIASGITAGQKQDVIDALEKNGFIVEDAFEEREWVTLVSRRG